jgi:Na+/phosphate symporter
LQKVNPDGWNNIPVCLVKAVKQLIEANISTDQRMRALGGQTENNVRKNASHVLKLEKDLTKKEEQLKTQIERSEKSTMNQLSNRTQELDNQLKLVKEGLGDTNNQLSKAVYDLNGRIDQFMTAD